MKHLVFALLALAASSPLARAQSATQPAGRHSTLLDVAGGAGARRGYGALSGWRLWGLTPDGRFQAGVGARATVFFLPDQAYRGQTVSAENSLRVAASNIVTLNTALHLRARVAGPVRVGFNIDLVGVSLGSNPSSQQFEPMGSKVGMGSAEPVRTNVLLGGRRDRGSINSDFYASADVSPTLSIHAGFSHVVNAYELDGQRFQHFANLGSLGLAYQLR